MRITLAEIFGKDKKAAELETEKADLILRKRVLKKSLELTFELPHNLQKYVCKKGSIAIDGISLTVNNVSEKSFSVSIIPHTSEVTTLGNIKKDDIVNIEIDILARYIENNIKKIK